MAAHSSILAWKNSIDRAAWWAMVHRTAKSGTWLKHLGTSNSATPGTVVCQAPLSMEFSRQEYWSGLPFSTPGDLRDPGIEPKSLVSPALAGRFFTTLPPGKPVFKVIEIKLFIPPSCYLLICATSIDRPLFIFTTVYWVFNILPHGYSQVCQFY